jgi:hypothetical protein
MNDLFQEVRSVELLAEFRTRPTVPGLPGRRITTIKETVENVLERMAYNIRVDDKCNGPGGEYSSLALFLLDEIELLSEKLKTL